jgi:hypothetical protein
LRGFIMQPDGVSVWTSLVAASEARLSESAVRVTVQVRRVMMHDCELQVTVSCERGFDKLAHMYAQRYVNSLVVLFAVATG